MAASAPGLCSVLLARLWASRRKLAITVDSLASTSSLSGFRNAEKAAPKVALTVSSESDSAS